MVKVCYSHSFSPSQQPEYHDYFHFTDMKMEAQEITQAEAEPESQP